MHLRTCTPHEDYASYTYYTAPGNYTRNHSRWPLPIAGKLFLDCVILMVLRKKCNEKAADIQYLYS